MPLLPIAILCLIFVLWTNEILCKPKQLQQSKSEFFPAPLSNLSPEEKFDQAIRTRALQEQVIQAQVIKAYLEAQQKKPM